MPPSLVFATILAVTVGLFFHSLFGRRLWQLPVFIMTSLVGTYLGLVAATLAGWQFLLLGNVPLVATIGGSLLGLAVGWFFTAPMHDRERARLTSREKSENRRGKASA